MKKTPVKTGHQVLHACSCEHCSLTGTVLGIYSGRVLRMSVLDTHFLMMLVYKTIQKEIPGKKHF